MVIVSCLFMLMEVSLVKKRKVAVGMKAFMMTMMRNHQMKDFILMRKGGREMPPFLPMIDHTGKPESVIKNCHPNYNTPPNISK